MGHLRKRTTKNGKTSWQIIIELEKDPMTGDRQRYYFTVNGSKKEADATMTKLEYELSCGNAIVKTSSIKLSSWLDDWMNKYNFNLSPTTKSGYRQQIRTRINPYLGNAPLNTLNSGQIQNWVNTLTYKGLSGKTIKNTFLNLKAALDKATDLGMISKNPCKHVELPAVKKYNAQVYTLAEVQNILTLAKDTDMFFLLSIEFYLGLRKGEIAELKWSDIDLDNGVVHIT